MAETVEKKTATKEAAEKGRRGRPKDAQGTESQASYYARKFMQAQSAPVAALVEREKND